MSVDFSGDDTTSTDDLGGDAAADGSTPLEVDPSAEADTAADGAGLAAPQIGVDLAVFVYECHDAFGRERRGLVCNPTIALAAEPEEEILGEGCLSLPGAYLPVSRPGFAVCHGYNQFGEPIKVAGTGTLARCLQHETDHINGIVMEDHLTPAERRDIHRQHKKIAKRYPRTWPA